MQYIEKEVTIANGNTCKYWDAKNFTGDFDSGRTVIHLRGFTSLDNMFKKSEAVRKNYVLNTDLRTLLEQDNPIGIIIFQLVFDDENSFLYGGVVKEVDAPPNIEYVESEGK